MKYAQRDPRVITADRRIRILDRYLNVPVADRAAFCQEHGITPVIASQWARQIYGQGLRELSRQLVVTAR